MTYRADRGLAALERAAAELHAVVLRECGDKAGGVWALVDQGVRVAREAIQEEPS